MIRFNPTHTKIYGAMLNGQYFDLDGWPKQDEFLLNTESEPASIVSMIDVDRSPPMNMDTPMSDMCPNCGGNCMQVGDYVCWGRCFKCYESETAVLGAALRKVPEW